MYIGNWKTEDNGRGGIPVENGKGLYYNNDPPKLQGLIYAGDWKSGYAHGKGESFWLDDAPSWVKNRVRSSVVKEKKENGSNGPGIPFCYSGNYVYDNKSDLNGHVKLKDGSVRKGPWYSGQPVGDFYNDHQLLVPPSEDQEETTVPSSKQKKWNKKKASSKNDDGCPSLDPPSPADDSEEKGDDDGGNPQKKLKAESPPPADNNDDEEEENGGGDFHTQSSTADGEACLDKQNNMEEIKAYLSDNVFKGSFLSIATIHEYAEKIVNEANYESLKCFKANVTGEDIREFYYMPHWAQRKLERKLREEKQKFKDLRDFLSHYVFDGRNLDTEDIDSYVHGLYEAGFQSVDELKLDLNDQNIEGLLWMPPNRRAVLMAKVKEVRGKK